MADVWLAGAYRDPGRNAHYANGRNRMVTAVAHFTVGSDSRGVGRDGYFHFLVHRDASRENGCTQYAEIDALTWHAGDYNDDGPGIEYERRTTGGYNAEGLANAEPLTVNQVEWGNRIVAFCAEHGIPATLYDGPRYGASGFRGWANHHDLSSDRFDGLTRSEWDAVAGGGNGEPFTMGQMDDLAQWEQDTRKIILEVLIGGYDQTKDRGLLAEWEQDTRAYVDAAIKASEQRIIAAIESNR